MKHTIRVGLPRDSDSRHWPEVAEGYLAITQNTSIKPEKSVPSSVPGVDPAEDKVATVVPLHTEATEATGVAASGQRVIRRGLPREVGCEHWPVLPEQRFYIAAPDPSRAEMSGASRKGVVSPELRPDEPNKVIPAPESGTTHNTASTRGEEEVRGEQDPVFSAPLAVVASDVSEAGDSSSLKAAAIATDSNSQARGLVKAVCFGLLVIALAGVIVLVARGITTLPGVPEFIRRYPGEYNSVVEVASGFPAWVRWSHFLNFFFLVLIVQSGLRVRRQQKPPAFYSPKAGGKKISIYLWLHTSLDVLWVINGVVFVVLLFVTGHWARVIPTSWEVFPNAISAMLQYLTLEWPKENGWVNYNSLQQLMYFAVIFIAAPLAVISGVRMSEWWPKNSERLNRVYPAAIARAIHFPTMLFFVIFVIIHVFLVFSTGALKNLNHMFSGTQQVSWAGFWWFAAGFVVIALVATLTRPLVLAPIASLFGRVSSR